MSKTLKKRMLVLLISISLLIIFARTVPQVSLIERAVVVGMGIDFENGKYSVSTQIINPIHGSQSGSSGDSYGIVCAEALTLSEAIDKIAQKTGLIVSLSQCNVLILGKGVISEQAFPSLSDLVKNWQIPEQAVLVATDEKAVDILRTKLITESINSFQIQQALLAHSDMVTSLTTTIKEFILSYISYSETSVISYITKKPVDEHNISAPSGGDSKQKYEEFDFTKTILFSPKKAALILEPEDTQSINFMLKTIKKGSISIEYENEIFNLCYASKKYTKKTNLENGRAKINGKIKVKFTINEVDNLKKFFSTTDISEKNVDQLEKLAAEQIKQQIMKTYNKCKDNKYDVFCLYDILYSNEGLKWKNMAKEDYLQQIDLNIEVDVKVVRR
ncbi:MAG: Ger(x)C family spore germination C-terminal domain-containing protein [Clostridia bacterium]